MIDSNQGAPDYLLVCGLLLFVVEIRRTTGARDVGKLNLAGHLVGVGAGRRPTIHGQWIKLGCRLGSFPVSKFRHSGASRGIRCLSAACSKRQAIKHVTFGIKKHTKTLLGATANIEPTSS